MITNISTLPTPPNRNDPGTFSDRADALLGAMPTLVTELNNFVSEVNTLSFKTACRVATTTSITLSGSQTIDGVSVTSGDRVLVKNQSNQADNGIYTASINSWTRAADMDTPAEVAGSFVPITFGSTQGGKIYYTTFNATGATLGTTAIPWNSLTDSTFNVTGPGVLGVANGGTNISGYSTGDLLYASGPTTLEKLPAAASGNVLKSGTTPSWGKVALASDVSGTLPASNGGTGLTGPGSIGNVLTSTGSGWASSAIGTSTTSAAGIIQLATDAEVVTGTATNRAITPSTLRSSALVRGTIQTSQTSPTGFTFTGIPSWAKRVVVLFYTISTNGGDRLIVRLGTSGGIQTSNYFSAASYGDNTGSFTTDISYTGGFLLEPNGAANATYTRHGKVVLENINGNIWIANSTMAIEYPGGVCSTAAGSVNLSNVLTQLRVTTTGESNIFDNGSVNIMYE